MFDAVVHAADCAILDELEARIAGDLLAPSELAEPGDPVFEIDRDGRFVVHPGVDGETRCRL
jgi:hypothetical protein